MDDPGLTFKYQTKIIKKENQPVGERYEFESMYAQRGRVFKIKRDFFERVVATKNNL